jgi:PLP dependent protein
VKRAATDFAQTLAAVRARISAACEAAGRNSKDITIVAVTKGFGSVEIESALAAGLLDIGENYYQEAADKFAHIVWPCGARRHFIGGVQRNKARRIAALFDMVQTLDKMETAKVLSGGAQDAGTVLDVLLQVNVAGDLRKGVAPDVVPDFALEVAKQPHLRVCGLMAMGPLNRKSTAAAFGRAARCFEQLRNRVPSATILSMGMSDDMDIALAHGSTMLRLGSALFGSRPRQR